MTGARGKGSYCTSDTKIITIDANDTTGNDPCDLAGVIAHEAGHGAYNQPYVLFGTLTRGQYVAANVEEALKNEGEAVGMQPPSPTAPPEAPAYYRYRRGARGISFGISPTEPSRVASIVLDLARK